MKKDSQSRKWQLTINNPAEKNLSQPQIKLILSTFQKLDYYCMVDEVGEQGTYHTHIYLFSRSNIRMSRLLRNFPGAHLEIARGTSQANRDYIRKEGKWEDSRKAETTVDGTFFEWGDLPHERQGARNDIDDLYGMVKDGLSDYEILEDNPTYLLHMDKIERVRQVLKEEEFKDSFRVLETTYIYGKAGAGKTRYVMEKYGYRNVYRITDYIHPFDNYKGQDIILFDEFYSSSIKISDMLNYLDGYPLTLPSRYNNKVACYTKVFIISNVDYSDQYRNIKIEYPETYEAFQRRIHKILKFTDNGMEIKKLPNEMDFVEVPENEDCPWK